MKAIKGLIPIKPSLNAGFLFLQSLHNLRRQPSNQDSFSLPLLCDFIYYFPISTIGLNQ